MNKKQNQNEVVLTLRNVKAGVKFWIGRPIPQPPGLYGAKTYALGVQQQSDAPIVITLPRELNRQTVVRLVNPGFKIFEWRSTMSKDTILWVADPRIDWAYLPHERDNG
jgi:hypothetical protein